MPAGFDRPPSRSDLRIGDRERDQVTSALHDAFAQGRITREELDERLETTLTARTAGDLRTVLADLVSADDPVNPVSPLPGPPYPYRGDLATWGHHYAMARRHADRRAERRAHHAHWAGRRRSGPPPLVPAILVFLLIAGAVTGSLFIVLKVAMFVLIGSVVFGIVRHRHARR
ncbi:hypothetical protein Acor_04810 [Acrocarpospora corrugata]|uniref:DUF1707 domain-containing protein n=1 Tax=Acrocarpospora corrugata TaxID=35763 RepID=A0A5M3VQX2_9ACTN|nr:DUF1707 domain-containing protein [Acrocarpospora corrugata]GER98419.1 hypothetical protein Acor_04810 [Acrocarpospora corrugata]